MIEEVAARTENPEIVEEILEQKVTSFDLNMTSALIPFATSKVEPPPVAPSSTVITLSRDGQF